MGNIWSRRPRIHPEEGIEPSAALSHSEVDAWERWRVSYWRRYFRGHWKYLTPATKKSTKEPTDCDVENPAPVDVVLREAVKGDATRMS